MDKAAIDRMNVGLTKQDTAECEWYEGIEYDAATELAESDEAITVRYKALNSGREWEAVFDLGNAEENGLAALKHAWDHRATVIA